MKWRNLYPAFLVFLLLLVLDVRAFTQNSLERKVTFESKNAALKRIFKIMEEQTKMKFSYSPEVIGNKTISIAVENEQVSEVLRKILDKELVFEAFGDMIILSKKSAVLDPVTVSGKVVDEQRNPLPGVSVKVKGIAIGTLTDANGNYSIRVPDGNSILIFSYVGFVHQEVPVNGLGTINVNLVPDAANLSEVVVIGYGTQKRENVIGSVAQIGEKQITNRPVTQLQNALTGQLAGVTVTQRNGRPGATSGTISVRGVGSFGAAPDALILVDGIPVGGFNDVDPNDVETISVLKDASSAAIYGARAANGVVLITTKSGKAGKTQVNYNGYVGTQQPSALPEFVNSWEYQQSVFEANNGTASATGITTITSPSDLEAIERFRAQNDPNYPNTDFIGGVITKNGVQSSHNISVNGGSEANQYNLSLGYLSQDGLVRDNNYTRYNFRLNLNTALSPKFNLATRVATTVGNTLEPFGPAGVNDESILRIIDAAVRYPNSWPGLYANGDYGTGINQFGTPISWISSESFNKQRNINLNGNTRLDYKAFKGFKASFIGSYVQTTGRQSLFRSTQRLNPSINLGPNQLRELTNNNYYYTLQGLAEYNKQFGKNQINILAGYSFEKNSAENFDAFRDNLPGNALTVINVGSPGNQQSNGTGSVYALESQFARANYAYANKYLVEGVIRRDGSSRFPSDQKYALFPSVAIGWRLGQESFIKDNLTWINELKLKASRGVLGNQNLGNNYPYQNTLVSSSDNNGGTIYSFGGTIAQGVIRRTLTDQNLHWESTRTTDVGVETALFNNKLTFSATYFDRYTYDILYSPGSSVSKVLGFNISATNTGKLRNAGLEFTVGHSSSIGSLSYNIGGNLTILKNTVLDLGVGNITQPNGLVGNGSDQFLGYPASNGSYNLYYGFLADGLFTDMEDVAAWPNQSTINGITKPGDIRYRDISGPEGVPDGIVDNTYDRTILGSQIPKYSFGMNFGMNYKGFDFVALLQGIAGVQGYLNGSFGYALFNGGNVQRWQYDGRFSTENPNRNAEYPRLEHITNSGTGNSVVSSFWAIDGSYLRIKNVQLGYTLPKSVTDKVKLSRLRFYLSGENLYTFSKYRQGWDPEVNTGANFYPIIRNYTMGLNVTF